jgi:heme exporter protein D
MSLTKLFEMGAYTAYVWFAYAITALGLILIAWMGHKRFERERIEARRRRSAS